MSSFGSWLSAPLLRYVHKEEDVSALRLYLFFIMLLLQSWRFRQVIPDFFVGIIHFNGEAFKLQASSNPVKYWESAI